MDTQPDRDEGLLDSLELPREAWQSPEIPAGLKGALLARTTAGVRSRTRRRRAIFVGGMVAAYAAGLATALSLAGRAPELPGETLITSVEPQEPAPPAVEPPSDEVTPALLGDPEGFTLLLVKSPVEKQAKLLKSAGDKYLNDYGDVQLALNCYRRLLALQGAESEETADSGDTWLLRSLKQARVLDSDENQEESNAQETL
ncbi:MAG: hypothetical protein IT365_28280 [Candidatus Hydrogenedentes bacterium]|nr:hypothetical protein [Candidatus Hydrogenedentota bacterium]